MSTRGLPKFFANVPIEIRSGSVRGKPVVFVAAMAPVVCVGGLLVIDGIGPNAGPDPRKFRYINHPPYVKAKITTRRNTTLAFIHL